MDTVERWAVRAWCLLLVLWVIGGVALFSQGPKPREYPALCIDPFASEDMGTVVRTWCKLVPMWSTKA